MGGVGIYRGHTEGVGVDFIRLAHADGIRTVNVVRRAELIEPLRKLGADVVVVDAPDLADRVAKETGGASIKLGIDAVAGSAIGRLDGTIHVDIEASYPLEKVSDAMAHAKRESRGGKVQLRPNG